jgi:four helix bundle protein
MAQRAGSETKPVADHRDLHAWQEAMNLVTNVYNLTRAFPREETFGLRSQMRQAAVSVPSNIAEGAGRGTTRELRQFLLIARGSLSELETQVIVAKNLGYVRDISDLQQSIRRLFKLLGSLLQSLKASRART